MNNSEKFTQVFEITVTELWAMTEKDFLVWLRSEYAGNPVKNPVNNSGRKATQKMLDYAKVISEWVSEELPETDDFDAYHSYISRNKPEYKRQINNMQNYHEAVMDSDHGDWGDRD